MGWWSTTPSKHELAVEQLLQTIAEHASRTRTLSLQIFAELATLRADQQLTAVILKQLLKESQLQTKLLRNLAQPPRPAAVQLTVLSEDASMLQFKLVLPAPGAGDVVARRLDVEIATEGEASVFISLGPTADQTVVENDEFKGAEGSTVKVSLVDIDNADNVSEPSLAEFVLVDTIAPPVPGQIGLEVTGEKFDS